MSRYRGEYRPNKHVGWSSTELDAIFSKLSGVALSRLNQKAVQTAAYELKEDVKEKFLQKLPKATNPNPKYSDVLLDAVRQGSNTKYPPRPTYAKSIVHILGVQNKDSMTFIARMFENGTKERGYQQLRAVKSKGKGGNRKRYKEYYVYKEQHLKGKLPSLHFLRDASASFQANISIEEVLEKYIEKINT